MNDPSWPDVIPAGTRQFKPRGEALSKQLSSLKERPVPFEKEAQAVRSRDMLG